MQPGKPPADLTALTDQDVDSLLINKGLRNLDQTVKVIAYHVLSVLVVGCPDHQAQAVLTPGLQVGIA